MENPIKSVAGGSKHSVNFWTLYYDLLLTLQRGRWKTAEHTLWVQEGGTAIGQIQSPTPIFKKMTRKREYTRIPKCTEDSQNSVTWDGRELPEALPRPGGSHQRGLHFPENVHRATHWGKVVTAEKGCCLFLWAAESRVEATVLTLHPSREKAQSSKQCVPFLVVSHLLLCYMTHKCVHTHSKVV